MNKITFKISLLFAPIAFAFHHFEEHIIFNFREWRLLYFPDNNPLSTEVMFVFLSSIMMIYIILHFIIENKASAQSVILFFMGTQVNNMIFHTGGTIVFQDFSPGLITAILFYIPVNISIAKNALHEGWVSKRSLTVLFFLGGFLFCLFEQFGPFPMLIVLLTSYLWIAYESFRTKRAH